jgi:phosphosulfolactate synthase (CoM biosynthesis protein A)
MKQSINVNEKRGRGRPRVQNPAPVSAVRLSAEVTQLVDKWAEVEKVSRSEAIRRLVELGLTVKPAKGREPSKKTDRAAELASKVIGEQMGAGASADQRSSRTRRLLKGPSIVRNVRKDRGK